MLHLYMDIPLGNENEPVALKTKHGWVIFAGRQNDNKYPNINTFCKEFDLGNMVSKFWQIKSFDVSKKQNPNILPQTEQFALSISEKLQKILIISIQWDYYGMKAMSSSDHKNLALSRLFSLEKKFKNHPMLETSYKVIMQEYISQEHASKLSKTEAKRTTPNTNYLPHHLVK